MKSLFSIAVLLLLAACSSTRETTMRSTANHQAKAAPVDTIVYSKLTFEADQKNYLPQLLGTWVIHTMQRQAKLPEETLNFSLLINQDKTYTMTTGCGEVKGNYSLKGVSIRFNNAGYESTSCINREQMDEMLRLLTSTVSLYTVNGNMLFLKDNSSNNVFRVIR